jgi:Ankyrin repeats (3 copies)
MSSIQQLLPFEKEQIALVTQKEYFINNKKAFLALGTESVRGCYAITIFHPLQQAIFHWDDNTNRSQLDSIIASYLQKSSSSNCIANIAGGWKDHKESSTTGEFLKTYFKDKGFKVSLQGYQAKKSKGSLSATGFSNIALDCKTGKIHLSDDWDKSARVNGTYSKHINEIVKTFKYLDANHHQDNRYPNSGTSLINQTTFLRDRNKGALILCEAARNNDVKGLISQIDKGITNVNTAPVRAKGWTALHYACKMGNIHCAKILIENGAKIDTRNESGKTPLQLMNNVFAVKQLTALSKIIQANIDNDPESGLRTFSIFSRHPERLEPKIREQTVQLNELLNSKDGLELIQKQLS